jgi:hypothetical protein
MKIRNGFVSNSSSSSFILRLSHKPKSVEELKEMMFPRWKSTDIIGLNYSEKELTIAEIVEQVFNDINEQAKRCSNPTKAEEALHGYVPDIREDPILQILKDSENEKSNPYYELYHILAKKYGYNGDYKKWKKDEKYAEFVKLHKEYLKAEDRYQKQLDKVIAEYLKRFRKNYKYNKFEIVLNYSDDTSEGGIMEHSDIFRNVPHIKVSNH